MAETFTTPFSMHGARDAIAGGLDHIGEHVKGIERAVAEQPGLAFDLAKTLVESACRTILKERSIAISSDDDLPKLFKAVTRSLPFLPVEASAEAEVGKSLRQTLGGLHTAMQGICELRNRCGFASHGSDGPRPKMEPAQAMLAAGAAGALVCFLHRVHRQDQAPRPASRAMFDENPAFNTHVDDTHGMIRIFDAEFRASEVLYQMERESYRVYLTEFTTEVEGMEAGAAPEARLPTEDAA